MTKAEEMLETLGNLRYQVKLSRKYTNILIKKYIVADKAEEVCIREALTLQLNELEDLMEDEFDTLQKYLIMKRGE